jgi:hypothetical protein
VVELEDRVAAPHEDPMRLTMRSALAVAKPDGKEEVSDNVGNSIESSRGGVAQRRGLSVVAVARRFTWDCCNLWKGRSERWAGALGGVDSVSPAWTR